MVGVSIFVSIATVTFQIPKMAEDEVYYLKGIFVIHSVYHLPCA